MVKNRGQRPEVRSKNIYILCLASCVFFLLQITPAFSQSIAAKASTDKSSYLVGDYVNYKIEVEYAKGLTVYPPNLADSLKDVSLIKTGKPVIQETNGAMSATYSYVLSGYDSMDVTIPQIPVLYRAAGDSALKSALTNSVSFTIRTVKVNLQEGIKDINPPQKIPLDWRWILLWVGVALLVIALIYYLYRRYKQKKLNVQAIPKVRIVPPYEAALNALHKLEEQRLWQKGQIKEYHSTITEIVRRYFESRFNMPALELPTSEAVELLKRQPGSEPIVETTYAFLSNADMVKFAKFVPLDTVNDEMMRQAYEIVKMTAPPQDGEKSEEKNTEISNVQ